MSALSVALHALFNDDVTRNRVAVLLHQLQHKNSSEKTNPRPLEIAEVPCPDCIESVGESGLTCIWWELDSGRIASSDLIQALAKAGAQRFFSYFNAIEYEPEEYGNDFFFTLAGDGVHVLEGELQDLFHRLDHAREQNLSPQAVLLKILPELAIRVNEGSVYLGRAVQV
ncbi:hypothetical protein KCM76_20035 [Zooshikella marina]|uniref:hypothetical protein n=1 Tax=Zooshikella ganghwensis TaxID=202772 RepID=UPI00041D2D39|nr:hypothetical protein [Zooshikella ganghwensis]MBU2708292.1 hypothetical protein [Zooshikella ganghwensis]